MTDYPIPRNKLEWSVVAGWMSVITLGFSILLNISQHGKIQMLEEHNGILAERFNAMQLQQMRSIAPDKKGTNQ